MVEVAAVDGVGRSVEAVEADRTIWDVDVADVTVEARTSESLELLEA